MIYFSVVLLAVFAPAQLDKDIYHGWHSYAQAVLCPDQNQCQRGSTCCKTPFKSYGCCPLNDAVCCEDSIHCCPKDYKCTKDAPFCEPANLKDTEENDENNSKVKRNVAEFVREVPEVPVLRIQQRPVNKLAESTTSLKKVSNDSAACPEDSSGSCPSGEQCCYNEPPVALHAPVPQLNPAQIQVGNSTNGTVTFAGCCPSDATCCNDASTGDYYGYCPTTGAQCCADHKHCCPAGFQCTASSDNCVQILTIAASPILPGIKAQPMKNLVQGHVSESNEHKSMMFGQFFVQRNSSSAKQCKDSEPPVFCHKDYTCCATKPKEDKYMCCPEKNAVCCSDHENCCPEGTTCDILNKICTK